MEKASDSKEDTTTQQQPKTPEKRSKSAGPASRFDQGASGSKNDQLHSDKKPYVRASPFKTKDKLICMFCGGKGCKHENYLNNKNSVIKGLDSDWILNDVLAMQRPSTRLIKQFNIIDQFKK